MTPDILFRFEADKKNNEIHVDREFAAHTELVWEAWTNPEILDQWWAPKPYITITHSMNFQNQGRWFYEMKSPEGDSHYCLADYSLIEKGARLNWLDAFCNQNQEIITAFPRSQWETKFSKHGDQSTMVKIVIRYESAEHMEKVIEMGFKEGFSMAISNLDQYLQERVKLRTEHKLNKDIRVCNYLNFPGNTEEAFNFYKKVFRSEFVREIQRFGEVPQTEGNPPVIDSLKNMVLHVELPILGNHILMGTDAPKEMGFELKQGNNMHISIEPESREETERIFNELSDGGKIDMPLSDMFWGAYYGSFTDKFGINWMLNYKE